LTKSASQFVVIFVIIVNITQVKMTPETERFNGWAAMIGFAALLGAYITTGQIIPGIY